MSGLRQLAMAGTLFCCPGLVLCGHSPRPRAEWNAWKSETRAVWHDGQGQSIFARTASQEASTCPASALRCPMDVPTNREPGGEDPPQARGMGTFAGLRYGAQARMHGTLDHLAA